MIRSKLRALVGWPIKRILKKTGLDTINRTVFGYDPFLDINRLSKAWQHPIAVFFDVGANQGKTALVALKEFPKSRIFSFEPHPPTFLELQKRIRDPRVKLINVALGPETGCRTMFEYDNSAANSLIADAPFAVRFGKKAKTISVPCTTIDDYCAKEQIAYLDVLKIDTEAFDHEVLKGAAFMLRRRAIKFIYFEFNDIQAKEGTTGGALAPIDALIRPCGYRFIATYNDYVVTEGELFLVSNALYALPHQP